MKTKIVLGTCFGDEGKGQTVSSFCHEKQDLVIRFNGGHQAGHTVIKGNTKHVFSTFGSGVMKGCDTYYSQFCTFYPKAFYNEYNKLNESDIYITNFYIHPLSMITTSMDVFWNHYLEGVSKNGSVGVGFGATIERNEESPYKLYAQDMQYEKMYKWKLQEICKYYADKINDKNILDVLRMNLDSDLMYMQGIRNRYVISTLSDIKNNYRTMIFEGAQGIMLDREYGFFPNVTRSNTTCRNAMKIIEDEELDVPEIYYIIRSYLTRHGKGYMPNEHNSIQLKNNENEINNFNQCQGEFRKGFHSLEMLKYAIACNRIYSKNAREILGITCLDQTEHKILMDESYIEIDDLKRMLKCLKMNNVIGLSLKENNF